MKKMLKAIAFFLTSIIAIDAVIATAVFFILPIIEEEEKQKHSGFNWEDAKKMKEREFLRGCN